MASKKKHPSPDLLKQILALGHSQRCMPPEIAKAKKDAERRGDRAARSRTPPEGGEHDEHQSSGTEQRAKVTELDHLEPLRAGKSKIHGAGIGR
jgi:hypothetical protein